jgi:hypothetical protein
MSFTYAPLPDWSLLWQAVRKRSLSPDLLMKPWGEEGDRAWWFSGSAWSFVAIAKIWQGLVRSESPVVWFPDYFCNGALGPLRALGVRIRFYPVTADLEPDYAWCQREARTRPPDIFFLVHYFGTPAVGERCREFCNQVKAWLVEDAAHVLQRIPGVGESGDFVCYSPHKHLPLPDGAILVCRHRHLMNGIEAGQERWAGVVTGMEDWLNASPAGTRNSLFWLGKRLAQKLGLGHIKGKRLQVMGEDSVSGALPHVRQSHLSRRVLSAVLPFLDSIGDLRRKRLEVIDQSLKAKAALRPMHRINYTGVTPYLATFTMEGPDQAGSLFNRFQSACLPVMTWPDLPPEVRQEPLQHEEALRLRNTSLFFQVHQSLVVRELQQILRVCC